MQYWTQQDAHYRWKSQDESWTVCGGVLGQLADEPLRNVALLQQSPPSLSRSS